MIIIDALKYNLDNTGVIDNTQQFQNLLDSFPLGSDLRIPSGKYKINGTINLKEGIKIEAQSDVIFIGTGNNTLFNTYNNTTFSGIGFQNCNTAIKIYKQNLVTIYWCNFKNNISFSAINIFGCSNISISNSFFWEIKKYGVLIDADSSDISIKYNNFSNPSVFGGFEIEQIGGHIYCLSGMRIIVRNNTCSRSGGQGIIFGCNSITGKGVINSIAQYNLCEENGQEGITIYGMNEKVTRGNSIINNTCKNNRFHQIEIWESDNNIVEENTVQESTVGVGNLGSICLFNSNGITCTGNKIISAQSNGIAILAGSKYCIVSDNIISDTNKCGDISKAEKGNGIILDWNGISDCQYISINNNTINSTSGIINKSGIYSTSNTNHHNEINGNIVTDYQYKIHEYALLTCDV